MAGLEDIQSGVQGMLIDDSDSDYDSDAGNKETTYIPGRNSLVIETEGQIPKTVPQMTPIVEDEEGENLRGTFNENVTSYYQEQDTNW